ncbi:MAG: PAS domain S-box protein [Candidatus Cloacimonetes bacterium]|nr:PAS domain S-box protein [Candidatus Cloacimonadota bacterium]
MAVILIINENKNNLIYIETIITEHFSDLKLLKAESPKEALLIANKELPDLIILDDFSAEMTGCDFCQKLKQNEPTKDIPIILLTAVDTPAEIKIKYVEAGVDIFLTKPIIPIDLTTTISAMLRIKAAENKLQKQKDYLHHPQTKSTKEIKPSKNIYHTLIDISSEGFGFIDEKERIYFANQATCNIFGYSKDEMIGKKLSELTTPESYQHILSQKSSSNESETQRYEIPILRKNGEQRLISIITTPKYTENGKHEGSISIFHDITEVKQKEKKQQNNHERLKLMNSIFRHNIANDLSVIKSAINIFQKEPSQEMLSEVINRVRKSLATIDIQRKQEAFIESYSNLEEYNLNDVLDKIIKLHSDIEITITGSGLVYANEKIYSLFENIISNSIIQRKSNKIDIRIFPQNIFCEIKLIDNGITIPKEIKDTIYDEEFHDNDAEHLGFSLQQLQQTIKEYNGNINIDKNESNGTFFIIELIKAIKL